MREKREERREKREKSEHRDIPLREEHIVF